MSCHRKNSVRVKVIGKKWIYTERKTFHRYGSSQKVRVATGYGVSVCIRVDNFILPNEW